MIEFVRPEAFLLALPLLPLLTRRFAVRPTVAALRGLALLSVLALLAEPYASTGTAGRDLVLVVDRSRSVGATAADRAQEVLQQASGTARDGDRVAVVTFGREPVLALPPTAAGDVRGLRPAREPGRDATDLGAALDAALALIPPARRGSLVVVSDGESTGGRPLDAARAALRRGVRLDAVVTRRAGTADVAIEELAMPGEIGVGEPFRYSAWIRSETAREVPLRLYRDGELIASATRALEAGVNRVVFRDRLATPGVHRYRVEIDSGGDRVPENDRADSVVRAVGAERALLVSPEGRRGLLAGALERAGVDVVVTAPAIAPLDLDALDGFRAVVLEDVPLDDLPPRAAETLATWVEDLGGGLLMTGGPASFGLGGYLRSRIEDVLPVSMEIRQEQRRFGLGMAIALDRSGSMAASAGPGRTKMDLANLGTIAALEMLGPIDSCAVIAVDSTAHVVVPMAPVTDRESIVDRVRRIESGGGGIFVFTALQAMANQLATTDHSTRHMVLFADAADAEEPGSYADLVPKLRAAGITLSVIALGDASDSDAAFLLDLARLGGGRCKFVREVSHLPRVFAQETLQIARSSFVRQPIAARALPDAIALGEVDLREFPGVGGYSIAYLRGGATVALQTLDDVQAPLLSFWQRGLGRAAAFLGEVDGRYAGPLAGWAGYGDLFATLLRWLGGSRAESDVWAEFRREGHEAVLAVEVAAGHEDRLGALRAFVRAGDDADASPLVLQRVDARRLEARVPLADAAVVRAAVAVGADRALVLPPVVLPYSPEFEPRTDPRDGERLLAELAALTGGRLDPPAAEWFSGRRDSTGVEPLAPWLAWLALALVLAEIAVRRLDLRLPRAWLRALRPPRTARAPAAPSAPVAAAAVAARDIGQDGRGPAPTPAEPAADEPPPPRSDRLGSVLERARQRADRRR
ncbi:MAG: VWA domain-containing protein [Planctomycetes bacterium]|nr:VWA domain-containing protein [Planctomycetota bacterium]